MLGSLFGIGQTTTSFWIQWRFEFIRLPSQETMQRVAPIPRLLPTLPSDIFYPFSLVFSAGVKLSGSVLFSALLVLMMIINV